MPQLQHIAVGLNNFVSVPRTESDESRNCPQRRQMLHRLVRGAILSISHRVMAKNKNRWKLHQGRQTNRGTQEIAEDKKRRTERPQFRKSESIRDRSANSCHWEFRLENHRHLDK